MFELSPGSVPKVFLSTRKRGVRAVCALAQPSTRVSPIVAAGTMQTWKIAQVQPLGGVKRAQNLQQPAWPYPRVIIKTNKPLKRP
jgi:hypothetical protein